MVTSHAGIPGDVNETARKDENTWSLSYLPSKQFFDPFDSLPIKLGLRQQKLLSYCKSHYLSGIFGNQLFV